ncbi:DNA polymerase-3 subunit beta [Lishizhenia tianjinensis]|uniref:Beta sliding clamp n=1 Tax=Lishizhenia tianjinensis TaxID=477690 RepID=A0A1I7A4Q6_9FLAO|nr:MULTISPECIES: DNA polymerase III subunit beta [Lishizhenia]MDX1445206.1 DNA polymerase III subunit beta [Lishizhenia sp.]SFT69913.1 DNA polymerase-3 subunit beta [Lishizhenia tianjinensis]
MNFVISSTSLLKQLQSISGVLSTSNTLPILDNFLFEINDGTLTISASDLETTMQTAMNIEANEDGKICIPAKILLDVLKNLPEQPLTFTVDNNTFAIEITYNNGKSKMVGYNGDDFPKSPSLENGDSITLSGEIISEAINKTLFATGNDDLRPVMSGVFVQFAGSDIIFVATDAHKLVRYKRSDAESTGSSSFILPKKPLNLLKSNLKGEEQVRIMYNESNAIFEFNDTVLTCRLIDGKYPNYEAVIPKENPNVLSVDRMDLLSSIKRVSIFANKTTHQVRLKMAGADLQISAEDLDFSNEANERLTCNYNGDDMEIGFNSRFLMEMLNNISSKEVKIEMSEPNRAGILLPAENENEAEDILMLVMPVMLNK